MLRAIIVSAIKNTSAVVKRVKYDENDLKLITSLSCCSAI